MWKRMPRCASLMPFISVMGLRKRENCCITFSSEMEQSDLFLNMRTGKHILLVTLKLACDTIPTKVAL